MAKATTTAAIEWTEHTADKEQSRATLQAHGVTKADIVATLSGWIEQRPGLEFALYGDIASYRSESRGITQQLKDARTFLRWVEWHDSITAEDLAAAFRGAFSGRLTLRTAADRRIELDYCTGQYWPTEYRLAAAAVLRSVIWDYMRDCYAHTKKDGDGLRKILRAEFGQGIGRRWFN